MTTNVIENARNLCASAEASGTPNAAVELKASDLKYLLESLKEQEREILGQERYLESVTNKIQSLVDTLDCYDFDKFSPDEDCDGDIFEIFVGTIEDNGRIFGIWDASSNAFHEPEDAQGRILYREDVIFWRYALPEPHEALDLGDPI